MEITKDNIYILVAEDNIINQMTIGEILQLRGYNFCIVENGKKVLEELVRNNYDLILMDVQMPEMDGLEATKIIRMMEKETGKHIPIIALTAYAMESDQEKCINSGMDCFLSKPVSIEILYNEIEQFLK